MNSALRIIKILFYIVVFGVFLVFAMLNNAETASVDFLFRKTPNLPIWVLVFSSLVTGLILGLLLTAGSLVSAGATKKHLKNQIKTTQSELNRMRNVSIEEEMEEDDIPIRKHHSKKNKSKHEAT